MTIEHSIFWLLLILPLSGAVGWWLYFHRSPYEDWKKSLRGLLASLRIGLLILLGLLLLEPVLVSSINDTEKPKLLVYEDVSASIPEVEKNMLSAAINEASDRLSEKFDIEFLEFAEAAIVSKDSQEINKLQTNFESVVSSANDLFYNQNIGAVVVATDGIQTIGADPRYLSLQTSAPVFALALGDSAIKPDFEISEVLNNKLVFFENDFQIKVRIKALKMLGETAVITLKRDGKTISETEVKVDEQLLSREVVFTTKADRVGVNRYSISITTLENEQNKINNQAETFVDVLDNRTRVLILTKTPHPDIAAIKKAIESNEQYEVEVRLLEDWNLNLDNVDLAILHGLPTDANDYNKIKEIRTKKIPVLSFITPKVSLFHFKELDFGLEIQSVRNNTDEVGAWQNRDFNLFNATTNEDLSKFPPVKVIFGEYNLTGETYALLNQRIGNIQADKPLLSFSIKEDWKRAVFTGEGWWRWRLFDRMRNDVGWVDNLMVKTVQYLALKQKRTRLNVNAPEKISEGKAVIFEADFYNQSFELTNDADLRLSVTDSNNNTLDYRFQNSNNGYHLSLGALAPNTYKWKAEVLQDGETFVQTGEFLVTENKAEFVHLIANFEFLEQWTSRNQGKVFYNNNATELLETLMNLETAKPIIHTSKEWRSIIEWKWLALLLILLAATEWFLRKLNGYY